MAWPLPMWGAMHSTVLDRTSNPPGVHPPWTTTTLADRNQWIRDGLPLVKDIAEKLRRRYELSTPFEDLCAFGVTGLLSASGRFDASRGTSFCTFAYQRIRGAILDGLRRSDRQYGILHRRLAAEGDGRCELAIDIESVRSSPKKTRARRTRVDITAVLAEIASAPVAWCARPEDADLATPDPDEVAHSNRVADQVRRAIEVLPARDRRIVELHYYGGDSLSEIAVKLGISRPWAYRLHARALETLKLALADLAGELEL